MVSTAELHWVYMTYYIVQEGHMGFEISDMQQL